MNTITRQDVAQAAAAQGVGILEALRMMQAVCAKAGDEQTLAALCAIKNHDHDKYERLPLLNKIRAAIAAST